MAKTYSGGSRIATGFKLHSPQPIVDYEIVDTYADLALLKFKYKWMVVTLNDTGEDWQYDGNTWNLKEKGGHTIQSEGVDLPTQPKINFKGTGVTVGENTINNSIDVTIESAGGGDEGIAVPVEERTTVGGETTWTVSHPISVAHQLVANGIVLKRGIDYTYAGDTFTFTGSYLPILVERQEYYHNVGIGSTATIIPVEERTTTGGETTWTVSNPISTSHQLVSNGVVLKRDVDYTYTGSTFTFTSDYLPIAVENQEYYHNTSMGLGGGSVSETDPVFTAWDKDYNDLINKPTFGDVYKIGTPEEFQIPLWTGDGTIKGDSKVKYDGYAIEVTGGSVTGSRPTHFSARSNGVDSRVAYNLSRANASQPTDFNSLSWSSALLGSTTGGNDFVIAKGLNGGNNSDIALRVKRDNLLLTAPNLTIATIDGHTGTSAGKQIVTKEWVENQGYTSSEPYITYSVLLNQTGTTAPIATVLENTTGVTFTYSRNGEGDYLVTSSAPIFTSAKTAIIAATSMTSVGAPTILYAVRNSTTEIKLSASDGTALVDDYLSNNFLEIRVYN